ncbi:MAG: FecCD family ABC transporter permease [Culicoidibacterales bacterium]
MKITWKQSFILALIGVLLLVSLTALKLGSIPVTYQALISGLVGSPSTEVQLIYELRLPRVIAAICIGANLAVAGVLLQAVIRNPLADPFIVGISSGASLASVCCLVFFPALTQLRPLLGVVGGAIACSCVYFMAYQRGRELSPMRIVLAGAGVHALLSSFATLAAMSSGLGSATIQKWLLGSLATVTWSQVHTLIAYSIIGLLIAFTTAKLCNLQSLGNKNSASLGVNPTKVMLILTTIAVFLGGISAAIAGVISFVGLIVPHMCRLLVGSKHQYLLPTSALVGAILVLTADTIGRTLMHPQEIPVGIVTCVLGVPVFLYLLRKSDLT